MFLVRPQCAALCSFLVSVHAEMCTRPDGANCSALGEPNADHAPSRPWRDGKPRFSGAIENHSRSFSALELLRGLPTREGVAVWKTAKMLPRYRVRANVKRNPISTSRLRKTVAREIPSLRDESAGEKMSRNLAEKRASPGRPQGNFHLDSSSRVRLTAACLRNPPPYFKSAPLQGAPFMEQLVNHIAALITLRLRGAGAGRLQLSINASASAYEFL